MKPPMILRVTPCPSLKRSLVPTAKATILSGFLLVSLAGRSPASINEKPPARPNILVIMVDDLSEPMLAASLQAGLMPNLQKHILNQGASFSQSFVTNSLCCPSRATFLTGQYVHNHGVLSNNLPLGGVTRFRDQSSLATWLQRAGYRTGLVGKYLNGYGSDKTPHPADDSTYIPPGWNDWQALSRNTQSLMYNFTINDNGSLVNYSDSYQTDVLAQRSVAFIQETEAAEAQQPFFLWITPFAPHAESKRAPVLKCAVRRSLIAGIRPAPRHQGNASPILLPQLPSFNEADVSDKPRWVSQKASLSPKDINCLQQVFQSGLESLQAVDDLLGSVVNTLQQQGKWNQTAIFFTSDNGFMFGEHRLLSKRAIYEQSIRVPLVLRLPGLDQPQTIDQLVVNTDLAPTIVDLAGARADLIMDGRSLLPLLHQPALTPWRKMFLVSHYPVKPDASGFLSIRTNAPTVFVQYNDGETELYDLKTDPYQVQNLATTTLTPALSQISQQLSTVIAQFKTCRGVTCQQLENQTPPLLLPGNTLR